MVLKFAANLNFLFTEGSPTLADKLKLAHLAGFRAVEIPYPANEENEVIKVKNQLGIEVSLVNIALGANELKFGATSIPGAESSFKDQLEKTVNFAKAVNCRKIHLMAGIVDNKPRCQHLETYKANLAFASKYLESENIIGVIEPINKYALPNYFMNCYETASCILRDIKSEHLKLLVDVYHLQHIRGNISYTFKELNDIIGHIQIAQVPHRHEPDVVGEIDYQHIFKLIEEHGYNDWIGCEYKPKTTTSDGLKWLSKYGLKL